MSRSLFAGLVYFALVFGVGFALGTLRVLVLIPMVGERTAELIEFPIMLVVSYVAATRVIRWLEIPPIFFDRVAMGVTALALLLAAEFGFVMWLRGISFAEYIESRDPLTGTIYYLVLVIFGAMPLIVMKMRTNKRK